MADRVFKFAWDAINWCCAAVAVFCALCVFAALADGLVIEPRFFAVMALLALWQSESPYPFAQGVTSAPAEVREKD